MIWTNLKNHFTFTVHGHSFWGMEPYDNILTVNALKRLYLATYSSAVVGVPNSPLKAHLKSDFRWWIPHLGGGGELLWRVVEAEFSKLIKV